MSRAIILAVVGAWVLALPTHAQKQGDGVVSIELPHPDNTFKSGPGQDLAQGQCLICHSADYVYTQPPLDQQKWKATVTKMLKVFGCPIAEENVDTLAAYLVTQNGPQK
jgi:mono/diheme cytochrome c family protein